MPSAISYYYFKNNIHIPRAEIKPLLKKAFMEHLTLTVVYLVNEVTNNKCANKYVSAEKIWGSSDMYKVCFSDSSYGYGVEDQ